MIPEEKCFDMILVASYSSGGGSIVWGVQFESFSSFVFQKLVVPLSYHTLRKGWGWWFALISCLVVVFCLVVRPLLIWGSSTHWFPILICVGNYLGTHRIGYQRWVSLESIWAGMTVRSWSESQLWAKTKTNKTISLLFGYPFSLGNPNVPTPPLWAKAY